MDIVNTLRLNSNPKIEIVCVKYSLLVSLIILFLLVTARCKRWVYGN